MITKKVVALAAALGITATALFPLPAVADNTGMYATASSKDWNFEITPYVWAPGASGTFTVRDHAIAINESFSDLFKVVKFATGGLAIANYKQWLIWTQIDYIYLNTDKLENPPARGNINSKMLFWTLAGGYRIPLWSEGQTLDVLVGEQGADMKNIITYYNVASYEKTRDIIDTVLILRPSFQLTEKLRLNPSFSYGGGDSEDTFQIQPQLQYQFTPLLEARIGYRKLHYTVKGDRSNELDLSLAGPFIGFGWTF